MSDQSDSYHSLDQQLTKMLGRYADATVDPQRRGRQAGTRVAIIVALGAVSLALVVGVVANLGSTDRRDVRPSPLPTASCPALVVVDGQRYVGMKVHTLVPTPTARIATGTLPACAGSSPEAVDVYGVAGFSSSQAVMLTSAVGDEIYVSDQAIAPSGTCAASTLEKPFLSCLARLG